MLNGIKKHNILRVPPTADVAKTGRFIVVLDIDTPIKECENFASEIEQEIENSEIHGKICEKSFVAKIITVKLSGSNLKNQLETVSIQCT